MLLLLLLRLSPGRGSQVQLASSSHLGLCGAIFLLAGRCSCGREEKSSLFTQRKCIPLHMDNMQDFLRVESRAKSHLQR